MAFSRFIHLKGAFPSKEVRQLAGERCSLSGVRDLLACLPWRLGLAKAPSRRILGHRSVLPGRPSALWLLELQQLNYRWETGVWEPGTLTLWSHGPGSPQRRQLSCSPSESEPAIVRATRDRAAERRGVTLLICCRVICLLFTTLSRGPAGDRCAPEEGLPASSPPPLASPHPCSPGACCIVRLLAGAPGDRLQMERGGCLFCFGGGGVSEPRTYLANEVVITPRLTNRMKTRGSTKATDGPRVCLTALQRARCRSWKGWVPGRKRAQRLRFWEQVAPTPSSEIPENYHTPTFPKPSTAPSYLLWWEIERRLKIPNYSYPSLDRIYSQVCTYCFLQKTPQPFRMWSS